MLDSFEPSPAVGSGTFGTVFPARAKHHLNARVIANSHYALKKLSLSSGLSLQNEMPGALHTVKGNANVVELLACCTDEEATTGIPSAYLVFPPFENTTPFKEYVRNITPSEFTAYAQQLLSALEFIHWRHIIHRDIKPGNILFNRHSTRLLLVEFGLAKPSLWDIRLTFFRSKSTRCEHCYRHMHL